MREIKFRGKGKYTGSWYFGSLLNPTEGYHFPQIWDWELDVPFPVVEGTVGEFTGLLDKDGKEIYEGDIIRHSNSIESRTGEVKSFYGQTNLHCVWIEQNTRSPSLVTSMDYLGCAAELKILGNIYENPELLEAK